MYSLKFSTLVALVIIVSIGYTYASTCQCFCCKFSGTSSDCFGQFTGNITVESCFNCNLMLCQSTFNSSCVKVNGYINSTCSDSSTSGGNTLFEPIYIILNSLSLSINWNDSTLILNVDANYSLVWEDNFENVGPIKAMIDGAPAYAPNPKNWANEIGLIYGGLQNYTDSIYNSYIQNNKLTIVAMKEGYTSARLNSRFLQSFTYGIFAAKICLPYGQGIWPSFWLLGNGTNQHQVWSPTAGEIDIFEMIGGHTADEKGDRIAYATIHWNNASNTMNPVHHLSKGSQWITPNGSMLHNNSYIYWTLWNTTNIIIGIDNIVYFTFNTTNIQNSINPVYAWTGYWPFYMILNIAIGGDWPGPPDHTTIWPQKMIVDWVRVYQLNNTNFN